MACSATSVKSPSVSSKVANPVRSRHAIRTVSQRRNRRSNTPSRLSSLASASNRSNRRPHAPGPSLAVKRPLVPGTRLASPVPEYRRGPQIRCTPKPGPVVLTPGRPARRPPCSPHRRTPPNNGRLRPPQRLWQPVQKACKFRHAHTFTIGCANFYLCGISGAASGSKPLSGSSGIWPSIAPLPPPISAPAEFPYHSRTVCRFRNAPWICIGRPQAA